MSGRARVRARGLARSLGATDVGRIPASAASVGRPLADVIPLPPPSISFGTPLSWADSPSSLPGRSGLSSFSTLGLSGVSHTFVCLFVFSCWGIYLSKILINVDILASEEGCKLEASVLFLSTF